MVIISEKQNMFWGITLDGGKRYSQRVETAFHVSMAALEPAKNKDKVKDKPFVSLMVQHEQAEFLLCTLEHNKLLNQTLDLNFQEGEEVIFFINGDGVVHLSGYIIMEEEYPESSFMTNPEDSMMATTDESMMTEDGLEPSDSEDEEWTEDQAEVDSSEEDSDDDDLEYSSKEEGEDSDAPQLVNGTKRKPVTADGVKSKKQKVIEEFDEDSEDEWDDVEWDSDEDEDDSDEEDEDETTFNETGELNETSEMEVSFATPKSEKKKKKKDTPAKKTPSKDTPNKKKEDKTPTKDQSDTPMANGIESSKKKKKRRKSKAGKDTDAEETPQKQKPGTPGKQKQETPQQSKKEKMTPKSDKKSEVKTPDKKQSKKQVLEGGVIVEELKEGHGPPATPGKMLGMYYSGRLQNNNKLFDEKNSGKPFKFRLGKQEVIKGWDVGVKGMKVGGQRKITVPPNMGYGKSKLEGIPPNSTLVFTVELKNVG